MYAPAHVCPIIQVLLGELSWGMRGVFGEVLSLWDTHSSLQAGLISIKLKEEVFQRPDLKIRAK